MDRNILICRYRQSISALACFKRWVKQVAAEQSVAPDRAAISVSRDTTPLQAARQVNAVVRREVYPSVIAELIPPRR